MSNNLFHIFELILIGIDFFFTQIVCVTFVVYVCVF